MIIEAVQKGVVTGIEPPASIPICGTINATFIIASIFSGERHTIIVRKGIPSSSYKREKSSLKISQPDDTP